MNKVRILGLGTITTGIFIGYYFNRTGIHLLSGMLIGVGIGWLITGRFSSSAKPRGSEVRSE
ncbi:hypothetical protein GCM10023115_30770 [Pontixanthobacter gangjinensis]|uniref:Uncharacterized protein n=1 Tax=Christiangramia aestuarii TaxID=1028746 RepID=A0A7K1LNC9_9FLAO|nr:hypothetical protein [Christiangramia aestuarii]MUP42309.1 hypothetical protein [Christiangramia aestuarii]